MKKVISFPVVYIFLLCLIFVRCNNSASRIENVKKLKSLNLDSIDQILTPNFHYVDGSIRLSKKEYIHFLDSLSMIGSQYQLIEIKNFGNRITTKEKLRSKFDSLFNMKSERTFLTTYTFTGTKIQTIKVTSVENLECYKSESEQAFKVLYFYIKDQFPQTDSLIAMRNLNYYLNSFSKLNAKERYNYELKCKIQGSFVSENSLCNKIEFINMNTVRITRFDYMTYVTSYEVDGDVIKVIESNGDILFRLNEKNGTLESNNYLSNGVFYREK